MWYSLSGATWSDRVFPSVATIVLRSLPLLWESRIGADVFARTAAPVVGGLCSCMVLRCWFFPRSTPWRRSQVRSSMAAPLVLIVPQSD
ncbi:hypothetical protein LuPra_02545 [Luteitalea pratensis]|uniref:Uncharacterized protein n=1 Tax=Luteitalea pratensis TaxID=1855912 RepID=A0A143PMC4_LUTPR|nr:hypothetical protein LuPra_02545 [Luteitalea pratensis]